LNNSLNSHEKSDFTSEILELAAKYQSIASDSHLGHPQTQNTSLQKTVTLCFKKAAPGFVGIISPLLASKSCDLSHD